MFLGVPGPPPFCELNKPLCTIGDAHAQVPARFNVSLSPRSAPSWGTFLWIWDRWPMSQACETCLCGLPAPPPAKWRDPELPGTGLQTGPTWRDTSHLESTSQHGGLPQTSVRAPPAPAGRNGPCPAAGAPGHGAETSVSFRDDHLILMHSQLRERRASRGLGSLPYAGLGQREGGKAGREARDVGRRRRHRVRGDSFQRRPGVPCGLVESNAARDGEGRERLHGLRDSAAAAGHCSSEH